MSNKNGNGRLFVEFWGNLKFWNIVLMVFAGLMFVVAMFAMGVSYTTYKTNRIPLVVKVSGDGAAQVVHQQAFKFPAGKGEIYYFAKSFIRELTGFNSFTVRTEVPRALNKMKPDYASYWYTYIVKNKIVKNALKDDVDFHITFKKIEITDKTTHHVVLRVILRLDVISNATGQIEKTSNYMDKVILRRRPRSKDFPFGLEVVNFTETKL